MRMRTSTLILIVTAGGLAGGVYAGDLAAAYVALVGGAVLMMLNTLEVKLNLLLDERGIAVRDVEAAAD